MLWNQDTEMFITVQLCFKPSVFMSLSHWLLKVDVKQLTSFATTFCSAPLLWFSKKRAKKI